MKFLISHQSCYRYSEMVSLSHNQVYLVPAVTSYQKCYEVALDVIPNPTFSARRSDFFGNLLTVFTVEKPHQELFVTAKSTVEVFAQPLQDWASTLPWESVCSALLFPRCPAALFSSQFTFDSPFSVSFADVKTYARISFPESRPILEGVMDLTARIFRDFSYTPASTTVSTTVREVFEQRRGVCQDFAHLEISCLRSLGLAARYVSGYLETVPAPGAEKLVGADASHAWLEVFIPDLGWVGVDPTNNLPVGDRHVVLAWGRDYGDVTPIRGVVLGGGQHEVLVAVNVQRL
jgi:transglutaminase-like putative cysteine protease